LSLQVMEI